MSAWPDGSRLLEFVLNTVDLPDTREGVAKASLLIIAFEAMQCDTLETLKGKTILRKSWPKAYDTAYDEMHPPPIVEESVFGQPDTPFEEPAP